MNTGNIIFEQRYLLYTLIGITFMFLLANLLNQEDYPLTENWHYTDLLYFSLPALAIILGTILSAMYRGKGNHGKAWIILTLAIVSWYGGELTYVYYNEYDVEDLTTFTSDFFYIGGYPLFFVFGLYYLKARKKIISKKLVLLAIIISLGLVIPSLYISFALEEEELGALDVLITASYPILDGVVLVPVLVGMTLFFRGQVNLLWASMFFAVLCLVIGDTLYLGSYTNDSYYPGHVSDMFFIWNYAILSFGFYSHIKLYRKESKKQVNAGKNVN